MTNEQEKLVATLPALWQRVDEAQRRSIEAKALAEYLNRNVVEATITSRNAEKIVTEMREEQARFQEALMNKQEKIFFRYTAIMTALISIATAVMKLM